MIMGCGGVGERCRFAVLLLIFFFLISVEKLNTCILDDANRVAQQFHEIFFPLYGSKQI